jgi:hypothetical protein
MSLLIVAGPSGAGPGEREQMLEIASSHMVEHEVAAESVVRIDVPGRGAGEEGDGALRTDLEPMIPLLQSGSLFGGALGLELVDAENLQKAEVESLVALLDGADLQVIEVVMVYGGAVPKAIRDLGGTTISVKKMWERQASQWLDEEIQARGLSFEKGATQALMKRFGTDTASMGQALDQLEETSGKITAELIMDRFKNRPDEPAWHITDAIGKGDVPTALRRLSDFLVHGHPLVYLAALESDLKKRALAAAAPDKDTLRGWIGGSDRQISTLWGQRGRVRESRRSRRGSRSPRSTSVTTSSPPRCGPTRARRATTSWCAPPARPSTAPTSLCCSG